MRADRATGVRLTHRLLTGRPTSYAGWAAAVVALGALVRVRSWYGAGSLNSDELWIVLNLRRRSLLELRGPLDYDQLAPLGWLWLEKLVLLAGAGDRLLRAPSLLAGCVTVGLTAVLARQLLSTPLALAATALVAGAPTLIYQSGQVKQYAFEAAAAVLLLVLAVRAQAADRRWPVAAFWLCGAVATWFATTAIFVTGAVGAVLVTVAAVDRRWPVVRLHALAGLPALASSALVYTLAAPTPAWLYDWWSRTYPGSLGPERLRPGAALTWSVEAANQFVRSAVSVQWPAARPAVLLLAVAGVVALAVRVPRPAAIMCAPFVAAYTLALLRLYPIATRVAVWLVPPTLVLVGAAMDGMARMLRAASTGTRARTGDRPAAPARWLPVAGAVVLLVAAVPWWGRAARAVNADRYVVAEQALRFVTAQRRPGDLVLAYHGGSTSALALWYGPRVGLRPDAYYAAALGTPCRGVRRIELPAAGRVWVLRVTWDRPPRAARYPERTALRGYGRLTAEHWYGGVVILRYDASPARPAAAAHCLISVPPQ
jgi:hypothetical protein